MEYICKKDYNYPPTSFKINQKYKIHYVDFGIMVTQENGNAHIFSIDNIGTPKFNEYFTPMKESLNKKLKKLKKIK